MALGAVQLGADGLIELGTDTDRLRILGPALFVIAALWLAVAVISFYLLQSDRMPPAYRVSGAVAVVVSASIVVAPLAMAARNLDTQGDLIDRVFASHDDQSLTAPGDAGTVDDPWSGLPRLNILMLGSDAGSGRFGVRPDTQILASIDTQTGDTVLLSLPRNLQRVPFPDDSPLAELYPNGYIGFGDPNEYLLNAVYGNVPARHPDVFADSAFPGADANKWAVEGALGLEVHYFVMVNLKGFEQMVDALGGVTMDVLYRIPIGTKLDERTGTCTEALGWIEPGLNQHLDGEQALWYARARCGPPPVTDDYNRMERQRCVIGAVAEQVNPLTVLRNYQRIAAATEDLIATDIPQDLLPALVSLARDVQDATISSLAFTDDVVVPQNPDYERMHELAAEAIAATPAEDDTTASGLGGGDEGLPVGEPIPTTEPEAESLTSLC
jgi:LCP family protein required for cell wall assembly